MPLPIASLVVFLILFFAPAPNPAPPPAAPEFRPTSVRNPEVKTAATFAVREAGTRENAQLALETIVRAERRVADRITYRLCLDVDAGDAIVQAQALVDRGPRWTLTLVSWSWTTCGK